MSADPHTPALGHRALIHRGTDAFARHVSAFLEEGMAAGEDVVLVASPARAAAVRELMGPRGDRLRVLDARTSYRAPRRAYPAFLGVLARYPRHGARRLRIAAEPPMPACCESLQRALLQYEAASNLGCLASAVTVMCAFDTERVGPDLLAEIARTHPCIAGDAPAASADFLHPREFLARPVPPVVAAEPDVARLSGSEDLRMVRALARDAARPAGLSGEGLDDLLVAVTEASRNALEHGAPPRRVEVAQEGPVVVCTVRDGGPGPDPLAGMIPPGTDPGASRGLWLARGLCDLLEVVPGPEGAAVRLTVDARLR